MKLEFKITKEDIVYFHLLNKSIDKNTAGIGYYKYEITPKEIKIIMEDSVTIRKWSGIYKIEESEKYYCIYTAQNAAYIFPKKIFKSNEVYAKFKNIIENRSNKKTILISKKIQKNVSSYPPGKRVIYFAAAVLFFVLLFRYMNPSTIPNLSPNPYASYPVRKFAPFDKKHKGLKIGDRLSVFGGYDDGPVHLELCHFIPDSVPYEKRNKGIWIEGATAYEFENLYFKYSAEYDSLLRIFENNKKLNQSNGN